MVRLGFWTGRLGRVAAAAAIATGTAASLAAPALADDIVVMVTRVRALDKIDPAGQADFYAKVTIAGETFTTKRIRRADDIRPNWVFRKSVPAGTHPVKLEIFDKDVLSKDDVIDINRINNKRDLDFRVDTRECRVLDFQPTYRCGTFIQRAGQEKKKAEVTFRVTVQRRR